MPRLTPHGRRSRAGTVPNSSRSLNYRGRKSNINTVGVTEYIHNKFKKEFRRVCEKKETNYNSTIADCANAVNTTLFPNNTILLTPNTNLTIVQGTGQANRIGDRIRPTKCELMVSLITPPYNGTSNSVPIPQEVEIYIFSIKNSTNTLAGAQAVTASSGSFFANGNTSIGCQGNLIDAMKLVNKDVISLYYRKRFKVAPAIMSTNTGAQANSYLYANNDFKLHQMIKINLMKKGFPKQITWNDTTTLSSSRQLFMLINPMDADGGANTDTTASIPMTFMYQINMEFIDA